jgi:hypothetical protein
MSAPNPTHAAQHTPELLEALEELLECCELNLDEMEPETVTTIEAAQAAILKAYGEAKGGTE